MFFKSVDIGVKDDSASVSPLKARVFFRVDELSSLRYACFIPYMIKSALRIGSNEPMDTSVEGISISFFTTL